MSGRDIGAARTLPADGGNSRERSSVPLGNSLQPRVRLLPGPQPGARPAGSVPGPSMCREGWEPWDASRNALETAPPSSPEPVLPRSPRGEERKAATCPPELPHPNFFLWKKLRSFPRERKSLIPDIAGSHGSRSRGYFGRGWAARRIFPLEWEFCSHSRGPGYKQIHIYANSFLFPLGSTDWGNLPKASQLPLPAPEGWELVGIRAHVAQEKEEASKGLCPQR